VVFGPELFCCFSRNNIPPTYYFRNNIPLNAIELTYFRGSSVDLCRLAGLPPVGVLAELMNDDGTVMRGPELAAFGERQKRTLFWASASTTCGGLPPCAPTM
jgi:hypothetical protein